MQNQPRIDKRSVREKALDRDNLRLLRLLLEKDERERQNQGGK